MSSYFPSSLRVTRRLLRHGYAHGWGWRRDRTAVHNSHAEMICLPSTQSCIGKRDRIARFCRARRRDLTVVQVLLSVERSMMKLCSLVELSVFVNATGEEKIACGYASWRCRDSGLHIDAYPRCAGSLRLSHRHCLPRTGQRPHTRHSACKGAVGRQCRFGRPVSIVGSSQQQAIFANLRLVPLSSRRLAKRGRGRRSSETQRRKQIVSRSPHRCLRIIRKGAR
jgi:hypothetical protein